MLVEAVKQEARPARPGEPNYAAVDQYTLAHLVTGAFAGLVGAGPMLAVAVSVGWELAENSLKRRFSIVFPSHTYDHWANQVGDVVAFMVGWGLVRVWAHRDDSNLRALVTRKKFD